MARDASCFINGFQLSKSQSKKSVHTKCLFIICVTSSISESSITCNSLSNSMIRALASFTLSGINSVPNSVIKVFLHDTPNTSRFQIIKSKILPVPKLGSRKVRRSSPQKQSSIFAHIFSTISEGVKTSFVPFYGFLFSDWYQTCNYR